MVSASGAVPADIMLTYQAFAGALIMSLLAPAFFVIPSCVDMVALGCTGIIGSGVHFLIIEGFAHAEASLLAPFFYVELLMQGLLGYAIFGDVPDGLTCIGIALIVVSGLYMLSAEQQQQQGAAQKMQPISPSTDGGEEGEVHGAGSRGASSSGPVKLLPKWDATSDSLSHAGAIVQP